MFSGSSDPDLRLQKQETKQQYRPESPPFAFLFAVKCGIEINGSKSLESTKAFPSHDVFQKSLINSGSFGPMTAQSLGFIQQLGVYVEIREHTRLRSQRLAMAYLS
jgi:hypothetical protein